MYSDKRGHICYQTVMKLSEYARGMGVSYKTVWRWWRIGKLDAYQVSTGTIQDHRT